MSGVLGMFSKQNVPPPAPVQPEVTNSLEELRRQLSEATLQRNVARDNYFAQLQAARLEPPAWYAANLERLDARVHQLESAVTSAEQEQNRADAAARIEASRALKPQHDALVGSVLKALKALRSAVVAEREFRISRDTSDQVITPIFLYELSDVDRLNAAIIELEAR